MKGAARTAALLAVVGAALAANEYYSIWTYTSELCTGEASSDLIRTENFRLWTCFDDGSGVTSIYSCDTVNGVVRVDYSSPNCTGTGTLHNLVPVASLDTCISDGKGYYLKHFCQERERYYALNADIVVYERLNQPTEPTEEECPEFPTYIRGTSTRSCIHDSDNDQSFVYYCDADGITRAVFDGPNCQGVGTVTGKHLGSDVCVDADEMPFLNATTGKASFSCISNTFELFDDDFDWIEEQNALVATTCVFGAIAGIMLTYLGYRWAAKHWTYEERISDPALKPIPAAST